MKRIPKRILLLHHVGLGNLGDDSSVGAVIGNIRERWQNADLAILSMNVKDTVKRHGLPCYPIRRYQFKQRDELTVVESVDAKPKGIKGWLNSTRNPAIRIPRSIASELIFLQNSYKFLKSFDLLIVTGGGQLTGRSGPWGFPYALFIWSLMAKRAGAKFMLLTLGVGQPVSDRLTKYFITRTLRRAEYVSFRDKESQSLAGELGFSQERSHVFPDNAYSMKRTYAGSAAKTSIGRLVGIAPMQFPFADMPQYRANAEEVQNELIEKMAAFGSILVRNSFSIKLFGSDVNSDPVEIANLRTALLNRHAVSVADYVPPSSVSDLLDTMSEFDYIVTCRFHGVVFAHLVNKPILAISHHPKVTHLMGALGLSEYCFDMVSFDPDLLWERFQALVANAESIKKKMTESLSDYRARSIAQFDELFPPGLPDGA